MELSNETEEIIKRLDGSFSRMLKKVDYSDHKECTAFQHEHGMKGWEIFYVPEDMFYDPCLEKLSRDDVVFDVGAGDMRFDLIMAEKVRKVYAVEINPTITARALNIIGYGLPPNLIAVCGNAFEMELPSDVTVVTCLMIHRQHEFPEQWKRCRIIYAMHDRVEVIESTPDPARL